MILGILVTITLKEYNINKNIILISILICMLYAISDEIHQIFISGRSGEIKELIEGNEEQKLAKKIRMQEMALAEQKEYEGIVKKQIADMEEDRRLEEIRKNVYNANGEALKKQMQDKIC